MDSGSLKSVVKLYSLKKLHVTIAFACWNCTMQASHRFPHDIFPSYIVGTSKCLWCHQISMQILFSQLYVCNLVYFDYYYLCHSALGNTLLEPLLYQWIGRKHGMFLFILIDNETMKLVWNFINDFSPRSHHLQLRIPCNFLGRVIHCMACIVASSTNSSN